LLGDLIGVAFVVNGLVLLPFAELILPLDHDFDAHRINPTTPDLILPMLLPFSSRRTQQPQQQVPVTSIPMVPMPLPSSGAGLLPLCDGASQCNQQDAEQPDRHPPGSACSGSDASCRAGLAIRC